MKYKETNRERFIYDLLDCAYEGQEVEGIVPIDEGSCVVFGTAELGRDIIDDNPRLFILNPKSAVIEEGEVVFKGNHYYGPNGLKIELIIENE